MSAEVLQEECFAPTLALPIRKRRKIKSHLHPLEGPAWLVILFASVNEHFFFQQRQKMHVHWPY